MSVKISEKDKALLIVLAIIVVVFAAIMMPKFGIKALYDQTKEIKDSTLTLMAENELKLLEIKNSGIPVRYAEDYLRARDAMEYNILIKKHEAIKIANIICNYGKSYLVPYEWTLDIRYLGYDTNDTNEFAYITYDQTQNLEDLIVFKKVIPGQEETEDEEVPVVLSSYRIGVFPAGINEFAIETEMLASNVDLSTFAQLLIYMSQMEQKGSILINSYTYNPEGDSSVSFTIYMTSGGEMRNYSALIGECPNCGEPYYYADAANGDYVCDVCNTPIDPQ